jgi:hypothetical protein
MEFAKHDLRNLTSMPFKRAQFPGVEGKTVKNIETTYEQQSIYVHIRFTDKTAVSISFISEPILYHSALYDETTGDQVVLRDYVLPNHMR